MEDPQRSNIVSSQSKVVVALKYKVAREPRYSAGMSGAYADSEDCYKEG